MQRLTLEEALTLIENAATETSYPAESQSDRKKSLHISGVVEVDSNQEYLRIYQEWPNKQSYYLVKTDDIELMRQWSAPARNIVDRLEPLYLVSVSNSAVIHRVEQKQIVLRRRGAAEIISALQSQIEPIANQHQLNYLGVFGSYVRNEQNHQSDMDVLVEFRHEPTQGDILSLKQRLSELVDVDVHVTPRDNLRSAFRKTILDEAIPVWVRNQPMPATQLKPKLLSRLPLQYGTLTPVSKEEFLRSRLEAGAQNAMNPTQDEAECMYLTGVVKPDAVGGSIRIYDYWPKTDSYILLKDNQITHALQLSEEEIPAKLLLSKDAPFLSIAVATGAEACRVKITTIRVAELIEGDSARSGAKPSEGALSTALISRLRDVMLRTMQRPPQRRRNRLDRRADVAARPMRNRRNRSDPHLFSSSSRPPLAAFMSRIIDDVSIKTGLTTTQLEGLFDYVDSHLAAGTIGTEYSLQEIIGYGLERVGAASNHIRDGLLLIILGEYIHRIWDDYEDWAYSLELNPEVKNAFSNLWERLFGDHEEYHCFYDTASGLYMCEAADGLWIG